MTAVDTYVNLRAFVDELVRCGLRDVCTSPGSRSTPLVLSLVRDERLRATSHLDERCGAFFALGLAKASGRPVALACTSGTAAANYAPAVIEAHEARVPLIVLTADRPPELRDVGAGQTIDQVKLYGSAAKWYAEIDDQPATPERVRWLRGLACRAYWTALDGRPGPVAPQRRPARAAGARTGRCRRTSRAAAAAPAAGRGSTASAGRAPRRPTRSSPAWPRSSRSGRARCSSPGGRSATRSSARRSRASRTAPACRCWPSRPPAPGADRPPSPTTTRCCATPRGPPRTRPQLVLRVGDLPTSKPLRQWLRRPAAGHAAGRVRPEAAWQDPAGAVATLTPADPRPRLRRAAGAPAAPPAGPRLARVLDRGPTGRPRARSPRRSAPPGCASRGSPPSSGCGCRPRRRWWSRPRCRCATSRPSGPSATPRRACSPTAAPTASTGSSRRRSASRPPRPGPWRC